MTDINRIKHPEKRELYIDDMIKGIGRKATDEELLDYLLKELDVAPVNLKKAFSKYL